MIIEEPFLKKISKEIFYQKQEAFLSCNDSLPTTQYCLFLARPSQASQEITHPDTTLVSAHLTVRF
jgi:hypothetical protein